jgi:hypothetical protein
VGKTFGGHMVGNGGYQVESWWLPGGVVVVGIGVLFFYFTPIVTPIAVREVNNKLIQTLTIINKAVSPCKQRACPGCIYFFINSA